MTEQSVVEPVTEARRYDPVAAQRRWQEYWAAEQTFVPADDGSRLSCQIKMTPELAGLTVVMPESQT